MDYCKYHPMKGATYSCAACKTHCCDSCVNDSNEELVSCFVCGEELESLGSVNTVEPFWRRLKEAFQYPVNANSIGIIAISSIISVFAAFSISIAPLAIVMSLFAAGAIMKYSFTCLETTALGEMEAPGVMDSYSNGIMLLFQLTFMIFLLLVAVGLAYYFLGVGLGGLIGFLAVLSFPAMLICFAKSGSLVEALNPLASISLILSIGLPYGLLIVFMLIMMSSVGVLSQILGEAFPSISLLLQAVVSNYYTVVVFHIMGYMLFQYQGQLGYKARSDENIGLFERDEIAIHAAKIEVMLKEGDYKQVVQLYEQAFKAYPDELMFHEQYFSLVHAWEDQALIRAHGQVYLEFLEKHQRHDILTSTLRRILFVAPDFMPNSPSLRVQLAKLFKEQGDYKFTVKLLGDMYSLYPEFSGLPEAYLLLAETLDEVPNMNEQAEKCRKMSVQLARREEKRQAEKARELMLQREESTAAVSVNGLELAVVPFEPASTS